MKIAILTESRYVNPSEINPYISNILTEDDLLKVALEKQGIEVIRVDWADKNVDWEAVDFAVFRSTWDYFDRFPEFSQWLEETSSKTRFINPHSTILWNMDKHYLLDLQKSGIAIPPTWIMKKHTRVDLKEAIIGTGWDRVILKPLVSGAARETYKLDVHNAESYQSKLEELLKDEDMMIQKFQGQITEQGEISLMVFGGKFSHAILKKAKPGDFRVQDDFGGSVHPYEANEEEIKFAENAVSKCNPQPVYARVDVTWDEVGDLVLMELELIEPEMWLRLKPESANLLAKAIQEHIM